MKANFLKFIILYQVFCYNLKTKVLAFEDLQNSICLGKHQMGLEMETTDLDIVVEILEPILLTNFDKIASKSIMKTSEYSIMVDLQYNDTAPTIDVNFATSFGVRGKFRFESLRFQWFKQVPKSLSYENITFPGELHAVFYSENAKDFEHALTMDKGLIALAFAIEVSPELPYSFGILLENLQRLQSELDSILFDNLNLKYWLNFDVMGQFYVYEGSLYETECKGTVLWIDFAEPYTMTPDMAKEFGKLKDYQARKYHETLKPKGKIFTNGNQFHQIGQAPPPLVIYHPTNGLTPQLVITNQVKFSIVLLSLFLIFY